MKRIFLATITALSLIFGVAVAQAHGGPGWGGPGGEPGGWGNHPSTATPTVAVAGTVVSVDTTSGTFVANAYVPAGEGYGYHAGWGHGGQPGDQGGQPGDPGGWGGQGDQGQQARRARDDGGADSWTPPSTTQVTINTNSSTVFRVDGQASSISGLAAGQRFVALFSGSPSDSLQNIVSGDAEFVSAHAQPAPRQLYAFVGKVTATDTSSSPETVTVDVSNSVPSSLVPSGSSQTFTVSPDTLILGGPNGDGLHGGSLSDVAVGDVVAGGEVGPAGETLSQVEASPLGVLLDFPAASSGSSSTSATTSSAQTRSDALNQALALFGAKSVKIKTKSKHSKHHGKKSHSGRIAKTR